MDNNILVIGIAGGTGSGKTTLMNRIIDHFTDDITVLSHDNYYRRHDELTYEQRCQPFSAPSTILLSTTAPMRPLPSCPRRSSL